MGRVFSFFLWPKREVRGAWKQGRKKRGYITCRTDQANEANKMFIIWLCWFFRFWKGDRELEVRTATYRPGIDQSQHAKSVSHITKEIIDQVIHHYGRYAVVISPGNIADALAVSEQNSIENPVTCSQPHPVWFFVRAWRKPFFQNWKSKSFRRKNINGKRQV